MTKSQKREVLRTKLEEVCDMVIEDNRVNKGPHSLSVNQIRGQLMSIWKRYAENIVTEPIIENRPVNKNIFDKLVQIDKLYVDIFGTKKYTYFYYHTKQHRVLDINDSFDYRDPDIEFRKEVISDKACNFKVWDYNDRFVKSLGYNSDLVDKFVARNGMSTYIYSQKA